MAPSTDPNIWNKEIAVPEVVISYVDDAVKASMSGIISDFILKVAFTDQLLTPRVRDWFSSTVYCALRIILLGKNSQD